MPESIDISYGNNKDMTLSMHEFLDTLESGITDSEEQKRPRETKSAVEAR